MKEMWVNLCSNNENLRKTCMVDVLHKHSLDKKPEPFKKVLIKCIKISIKKNLFFLLQWPLEYWESLKFVIVHICIYIEIFKV